MISVLRQYGRLGFYTILVAQVSKYVSAYSAVAWAGLLGSLTTAAYSILTGQFALPYDLSALAWGVLFLRYFYRQPGRYAVLEQRHPRYRPQSGRRVYESDAVGRHHLRHRLSRRKLLYFEAVGGALIIAGVYLTTQYRLLAINWPNIWSNAGGRNH